MNKPVDLAAQARQAAAELLAVPPDTIQDLTPLDAGPTPTNNSFTFKLGTQQLLVRLPGPGTEGLIDRAAERAAYQALAPHGLADEVLALDQAGRRITVFYPDARVADGAADADLALCMAALRRLHGLDLPVQRRFDIGGMIAGYEALCAPLPPPPYPDLGQTRCQVAGLLGVQERLAVPEVFCHGDMLPANLLILPDGSYRLIDYEYSGRADPIMDIAMLGIYCYFPPERLELSLQLYLEREPTGPELARLYLYTALAGYLWSLWAHVKTQAGQDLTAYGQDMYGFMVQHYGTLTTSGLLSQALAEAPAGHPARLDGVPA